MTSTTGVSPTFCVSGGRNKHSKKIPHGSLPYYLVVGVAGGVSTASTHFVTTPLDVVKCRMQTEPQKYTSTLKGFRIAFKEGGFRSLVGGWAPSTVGWGLRGFFKFPIYEYLIAKSSKLIGDENAHKYRFLIYLGSVCVAESISDVALAPFEAAKVRTQTDPTAPRDMRSCMKLMYKEGGVQSLFKAFAPLWMRQIPGITVKFMTFELFTESMYRHILNKKRKECTNLELMGVTVSSSAMAGVCCAVISHPADVWVSQICRHKHMTFMEAVKSVGFRGLTAGFGARLVMITWIASTQLNTTEFIKMLFNLELARK